MIKGKLKEKIISLTELRKDFLEESNLELI